MGKFSICDLVDIYGLDPRTILENIVCNYMSSDEVEDCRKWLCKEYDISDGEEEE